MADLSVRTLKHFTITLGNHANHNAAINIQVSSRQTLDERLDAAVKELQEAAMLTGMYGILITRNRPGSYRAALSDQVPFGMTRELIK